MELVVWNQKRLFLLLMIELDSNHSYGDIAACDNLPRWNIHKVCVTKIVKKRNMQNHTVMLCKFVFYQYENSNMKLIYVISITAWHQSKSIPIPQNGGMRVAEGKFRISFSRERARVGKPHWISFPRFTRASLTVLMTFCSLLLSLNFCV